MKKANGFPKGSGLYWNGSYIYCKIWDKRSGKKMFQGSTRETELQAALRFIDIKRAELIKAEDTSVELVKGVTVNELLDDYVRRAERKEEEAGAYAVGGKEYERNSYKLSSRIDKNLRPFFGKLQPADMTLTTDLLERYLAKRKAQKATVPTTNTEFRILRAALKRGTKTTPRKVNPLHIPDFSDVINQDKENQHAREGTISESQYKLILEHAPEHLKPVFCAIYYSGIRSKEIKWVRRSQVDFAAEKIYLMKGETKDGDSRAVGMNLHVKRLLQEWEKQTAEKYPHCKWFFHLNGEQLGNWKTAWKGTLRRAGLKSGFKEGGLVFHDTRRTHINDLDGLVEEKDIMNNSGHKTIAMSRRYGRASRERAAERVAAAQNQKLGLSPVQPATNAPATSNDDPEAKLTKLKTLFEKGLMPQSVYEAKVAEVVAAL